MVLQTSSPNSKNSNTSNQSFVYKRTQFEQYKSYQETSFTGFKQTNNQKYVICSIICNVLIATYTYGLKLFYVHLIIFNLFSAINHSLYLTLIINSDLKDVSILMLS